MRVVTKIFTKKGVIKKKKIISSTVNPQQLKRPLNIQERLPSENCIEDKEANGNYIEGLANENYIDEGLANENCITNYEDKISIENYDEKVVSNGYQNFYHFPFRWIWNNPIMGVKYNANNFKSRNQIHIIQDFNLVSQEKSEIQYENTFCCVLLNVIIFEDHSKRLISVCSHPQCQTSGDINRFIFIIL